MLKASLVVAPLYQKNKIFDLSNKTVNRDNCCFPLFFLKKVMQEQGVILATSDIHTPSQSDIVIYHDMPIIGLPPARAINKSMLLIFESEVIRPDNWQLEKHRHFAKIFTWHDEWVDNVRYFKMHYSYKPPESAQPSINIDLSKKTKLCVLIASNKRMDHGLELYSKRVEAIRWFERHHPQDFDLYGFGWDRYRFSGPRVIRALNRIKPLTRLLAPLVPEFPSWKGMVMEKKAVLERYKFAICYENARDIPGYITEKIWDCFLAGCVPIYWGANNIEQYIPTHCFIDKTAFSDYASLYRFIKHMSEAQYSEYLYNIELFLHSEKAALFSSQYFVDTLMQHIPAPSSPVRSPS